MIQLIIEIFLKSQKYCWQETVINEMIKMAFDLQRETLDSLVSSRPGDLQFAEDLNKIYEEVEEQETEENESLRLAAESRVMRVVQEHGEKIGHGDLLTSAGLNKKT